MSRPAWEHAIAAPLMLLAALLLGCVAHSGQLRVSAGYGFGYWGPPIGFHYGVWGPRYRVAPFHAPVRRSAFVAGPKSPRAFRGAPVGRPVPSLPPPRKGPTRRRR